MPFCNKCGKKNDDDAQYCIKCGNYLTKKSSIEEDIDKWAEEFGKKAERFGKHIEKKAKEFTKKMEEISETKKCLHCSAKINIDAKFCWKCGKKIK